MRNRRRAMSGRGASRAELGRIPCAPTGSSRCAYARAGARRRQALPIVLPGDHYAGSSTPCSVTCALHSRRPSAASGRRAAGVQPACHGVPSAPALGHDVPGGAVFGQSDSALARRPIEAAPAADRTRGAQPRPQPASGRESPVSGPPQADNLRAFSEVEDTGLSRPRSAPSQREGVRAEGPKVGTPRSAATRSHPTGGVRGQTGRPAQSASGQRALARRPPGRLTGDRLDLALPSPTFRRVRVQGNGRGVGP